MRIKRTLTTIALTAAITAGTLTFYSPHSTAPTHAKLAPAPARTYVSQAAVINELESTPQLVGLTGDIHKTVRLTDDKWFGDKTYELTLTGTFKLGVDTADVKISVEGNTVHVRLPQPHIISVDLPFDQASIKRDVGWLRADISETELQALYGEARTDAIHDIHVNIKARDKAADAVEDALGDLIRQVDGVKAVEFE